MSIPDATTGVPAAPGAGEADAGEQRWPPILALVLFTGLNIGLRLWLPQGPAFGVPWIAPAVEVALLVMLLTVDPSRLARDTKRTQRTHVLAVALVLVLVFAALAATGLLTYDLIQGAEVTESPGPLLAAGTLIWLGNNLAFALLFWLLDGGGPIARTRRAVPVDFAFTQHMSPELAPPGWRPVFLDYLHLSFTNATAFSPTDVMPLTVRAKYTMLVQSTISLALFGLIIARAVNAFT